MTVEDVVAQRLALRLGAARGVNEGIGRKHRGRRCALRPPSIPLPASNGLTATSVSSGRLPCGAVMGTNDIRRGARAEQVMPG